MRQSRTPRRRRLARGVAGAACPRGRPRRRSRACPGSYADPANAQMPPQLLLRGARRAPRTAARGTAPGADPPPELAGRPRPRSATGMRSPRRRAGGPSPRHDPLRHREERERRVAAVADEVDEARVGKEALEQRRCCMYIGVLSPQRCLPCAGRVRLEDGADRLARRHPGAQPRAPPRPATVPTRGASAACAGRRGTRRRSTERPRCRWASWGTKYDSSGTAIRLLRSSMTRSSVVPERRTPRTRSGGSLTAPPDVHDRPIGVAARLDEEGERAGRPGRAQDERLPAPRVPVPPANRQAKVCRVGASRRRRIACRPPRRGRIRRELDVAELHGHAARRPRAVPGPVDRDEPRSRTCPAGTGAVLAAEPVERSLERRAPAQHPLLAVDEEDSRGRAPRHR